MFARKLHHGFDLSIDAVAPGALLVWRNSLTRLQALCKKSITSACCPTLRSRARIRSSPAAGAGTGRLPCDGPGGRPRGRASASTPSFRYAARQRYRMLRFTFTSRLSADTASPASIRCTTCVLNSTVKTLSSPPLFKEHLPFTEKCPYFLCLNFGVQSTRSYTSFFVRILWHYSPAGNRE